MKLNLKLDLFASLSLWLKLYFKDETLSTEHSAVNCLSQQIGILMARVTLVFSLEICGQIFMYVRYLPFIVYIQWV